MADVLKFQDVPGRAMKFRNFSGKEGKFNVEGSRYFCLAIDPESAERMFDEGYNVKYAKPRDEDDAPMPYIQVKVKYGKGRPPKVVMLTRRGKTELDEETIGMLDWADIESADIAINPFSYDVQGHQGIAAYLKTMYVKIVEDEFEDKYYDVPESAKDILLQNNEA